MILWVILSKILRKSLAYFLSFLVSFCCLLYAQEKSYSQQEIDDYKIVPLTQENLALYKNVLETNPKVDGWVKYYAMNSYFKQYYKQFDSAVIYGNKAINYFENSTFKRDADEAILVNAHFAIGRAYYAKKEYPKSLKSLLRCLDLEKKYPVRSRGYIISSIANNHLALGNDSLAIDYFSRALNDSLYSSNGRSRTTALMRIGVLYGPYHLNRPDSSKIYLHKALSSAIETGKKNNLVATLSNLGDVHKAEGRLDSTLYYYSRANDSLKVHKPLTKEGAIKISLYNISNFSFVKINEGRLNEAISDLNGVLDSLNNYAHYDKNDKGLFIATYDNLILAYQSKGDYDNMNKALAGKEAFLAEFHRDQLKQELEKLQIQFETREKESEIKKLEALNTSQEVIQRQQILIFSGVAILFLAIMIGLWLYFRQRNLNNSYKQVVLEQQLLRTQMNPHFFFNALNTINALQKDNPNKVEKYVVKLSKLVRLTLENSREEFVPLSREIEALTQYLELQSNFSKKFSFAIHIDSAIQAENILLPPMLIQPFVENAILHGIAPRKTEGNINISVYPKGKKALVCSIQDNGIGYGQGHQASTISNKQHTSLSEKIVRERMSIISKKRKTPSSIQITVLKPEDTRFPGSKVNLTIPMDFI